MFFASWVVPMLAGDVLTGSNYMCRCIIAGWTWSLLAGLFQCWREKYWPKPAICVGVSLQVGHVLCCWVVSTLVGEVLAEASYMCWCVIAGWTCSLVLAGLFQRWREKYWPKPAICVGVSL